MLVEAFCFQIKILLFVVCLRHFLTSAQNQNFVLWRKRKHLPFFLPGRTLQSVARVFLLGFCASKESLQKEEKTDSSSGKSETSKCTVTFLHTFCCVDRTTVSLFFVIFFSYFQRTDEWWSLVQLKLRKADRSSAFRQDKAAILRARCSLHVTRWFDVTICLLGMKTKHVKCGIWPLNLISSNKCSVYFPTGDFSSSQFRNCFGGTPWCFGESEFFQTTQEGSFGLPKRQTKYVYNFFLSSMIGENALKLRWVKMPNRISHNTISNAHLLMPPGFN